MARIKVTLLYCAMLLSLLVYSVECTRDLTSSERDKVTNSEGSEDEEVEIESISETTSESFSEGSDSSQETLNSTPEANPDDRLTEKVQEPKEQHQPSPLGPKVTDWDEQRAQWLEERPHMRLNRLGQPRMVLLSSSQSEPCASSTGDHLLLKSLKNKIDYARLHDIEIYYNMVLMETTWTDFWIKMPLVRKLMLTHPEAEWIWWMDSDALFTDMTFEVPLERYKDHNLVVHGWASEIYEKKNWVGLNAGIYLMRNCQWSLDLMDIWAAMGEGYNRQEMGNFLSDNLVGRPPFVSDDQSALVYLLSTSMTEELKPFVFLENSYALHGYWVWVMGKLEIMLNDSMPGAGGDDWPFITHFVGCKPCSGTYTSYDLETCVAEMERAYNLADNQVLQMYGFEHDDLASDDVSQFRKDAARPLDHLSKSPLDYIRQHPWISRARRERDQQERDESDKKR